MSDTEKARADAVRAAALALNDAIKAAAIDGLETTLTVHPSGVHARIVRPV